MPGCQPSFLSSPIWCPSSRGRHLSLGTLSPQLLASATLPAIIDLAGMQKPCQVEEQPLSLIWSRWQAPLSAKILPTQQSKDLSPISSGALEVLVASKQIFCGTFALHSYTNIFVAPLPCTPILKFLRLVLAIPSRESALAFFFLWFFEKQLELLCYCTHGSYWLDSEHLELSTVSSNLIQVSHTQSIAHFKSCFWRPGHHSWAWFGNIILTSFHLWQLASAHKVYCCTAATLALCICLAP